MVFLLERTAAFETKTAGPGDFKILFFADVIHDSHGDAVIPLRVGRLVWIVRKSGLLVIVFKQTQGPLGLQSPLHPSSAGPRVRAARERGLGEPSVQRKRKAILSTAK